MVGTATAGQRDSMHSDLIRGCGGIGIIWNKRLKATPHQLQEVTLKDVTIDSTTSPILVVEGTGFKGQDYEVC